MDETCLHLDGDNSGADAIADFVEHLAQDAGLPQPKAYWLRLAVDEITTNIFDHGYADAGPIWLSGLIKPECVRVRIEDTAPAFDPGTHDHEAKLALPPAEREAGGFGLLLARRKLDEFAYEYADGKNRNTLIMYRTIGKPDGIINRASRG